MSIDKKVSVAILHSEFMDQNQMEKLANRIHCPVIQWQPPESITSVQQLITVGENGILQLIEAGKKKPVCVYADFVSGKINHRRLFGGGKGQAIAKAVGLQDTSASLSVLDATAGLGRDAFILASLGCTVTLLERSPVIASLLEDGISRACEHKETAKIMERISMQYISAQQYLEQLPDHGKPSGFDIIYLDPMFPHRKKSALVKKEMQQMQKLLAGDGEDADMLLSLSLKKAKYRVVIKRPRIAPDLGGQPPSYRLQGKTNRFDIHVIKSIKNTAL